MTFRDYFPAENVICLFSLACHPVFDRSIMYSLTRCALYRTMGARFWFILVIANEVAAFTRPHQPSACEVVSDYWVTILDFVTKNWIDCFLCFKSHPQFSHYIVIRCLRVFEKITTVCRALPLSGKRVGLDSISRIWKNTLSHCAQMELIKC